MWIELEKERDFLIAISDEKRILLTMHETKGRARVCNKTLPRLFS
jgi:hypothetical protein